MRQFFQRPFVTVSAISLLTFCHAAVAQTVFSDSGADAASITATVDAFRNALGTLNAPDPVNNPDGRRQINWDAAPDFISAPNSFPGDFFNFNANPRARGIEFATPGTDLQLSANAGSGTDADFANINPQYADVFEAFSPQRLFTPIGSNIVDVTFFDPANNAQPALVDGLGVVFSDVDFIDVTRMDFYGENDAFLASFNVPNYVGTAADNEHFSFLGVQYDENIVSRVRIYAGTDALGPNEDLNNSIDLVVMDDFIFGEPVAIPEPATSTMLAFMGLVGCGVLRRKR